MTVLDIIPLISEFKEPSFFSQKLFELAVRNIKTADALIAISEWTKQDLVKHFNINPDKILVIPLAVDREFRPLNISNDTGEIRILYVGSERPRKNLNTLLEALYIFTSVTNSGFLTALYVPLVPFFGFLFLRRRVHFVVWPASICCFIGTYIMSGAQQLQFADGDLWVIASTIFWAVHVMLVGAMASKTRAPLVVAAAQFTVCGLSGLVLGYLIESPVLADFTGAIWGVCYVGVFSVGMAFTLQVIGQRYTPAPDAAIILSTETVFAALGGMLFLGEQLTIFQISGGALIFASIISVELLPHTKIGKVRTLK